MSMAILSSLLLAGAALPAADQAAVNARVAQIFRGYSRPTTVAAPAMFGELPIPASQANRPRLTPVNNAMAMPPAKPPAICRIPNAPPMISPITPGRAVTLTATIGDRLYGAGAGARRLASSVMRNQTKVETCRCGGQIRSSQAQTANKHIVIPTIERYPGLAGYRSNLVGGCIDGREDQSER